MIKEQGPAVFIDGDCRNDLAMADDVSSIWLRIGGGQVLYIGRTDQMVSIEFYRDEDSIASQDYAARMDADRGPADGE